MIAPRTNRGASMIAIMIAFVFFFVILGAGIYGYIFLTGSAKSLQEATDAAAINVAKQAMSSVYANLSVGSSPTSYFDAAMTPVLGTNNLNLYGYNKAVARAVMVSLNALDMQTNDAKAAGVDLTSNGAINSANQLIARLQGGPNSIGGQLQKYLTTGVDGSGNAWAQQAFNQVAVTPLSSLVGAGVQYDNTQFAAAYFTGTGESTAIAPVSEQLASPWSSPGSAVSGSGALVGYGSGITIGTMNMVAVPADPTQAPHLLSLSNFSDPTQNWNPKGIFVPPNAFKIGASAVDKQTKAPTYAKSASLIGGLPSIQSAQSMFALNLDDTDGAGLIPQLKHLVAYLGTQPAYADVPTTISASTAAIPGGYMLVDNSNSTTPNSTGSIGVMQNVFTDELGVGITVDDTTSMFSNNGAVQNWQGFPHTPPAAGVAWDPKTDKLVTDPSKIPSLTGLYNPDGSAATLATAGAIPYADPKSTPPPTSLCTDQNSESADPSSDPDCVKLASPTSGGGLDPFDVAYHPGASPKPVNPPAAALTAAEVAKVMLISLWQWPLQGAKSVDFDSIHPTGVRLWPGDTTPDRQGFPQWPYETGPYFGFAEDDATSGWWDGDSGSGYEGTSYSDPGVLGKISHEGTVYKLFHQIDPSDAAYNNFVNVAATRVMQMGAVGLTKSSWPGAPSGTVAHQINHLFTTVNVPLGARLYLYLSVRTDSNGKQTNVVALDSNGPSWLSGAKATQSSQALQTDLVSNLNNLQGVPASQWNSSGNVTPAGPSTGAVQLDGVWVPTSHSFNAEDSIVNPHYEWNIHDQAYTASGNAPPGSETAIAQVTVTETAAYQKTSGAYGLLGVLKFQEQVAGSGTAYYWAPN